MAPHALDRSRIRVRSWLVLEEARRRGYLTTFADYARQTFRVERDGLGLTFEKLPGVSRFIRRHGYGTYESKPDKKRCLRAAGVPVPDTLGVFTRASDMARGAALPFPVIVKPVVGTTSTNVRLARDPEQAVRAGRAIEESGQDILIEEYIQGRHFRIVLVGGRLVGAVERRPASVVGDGESTVGQLVVGRNAEPGRGPAEAIDFTNHRLSLTADSEALLAQRGLTTRSVIGKGNRVFIQSAITAASGADYVDCTDGVHATVREMCERFARSMDLLVVGVDYIASDISDPTGACNEFNLRPYIDLNENNNEGMRRPVSAAIWDHIERIGDELLTRGGEPF